MTSNQKEMISKVYSHLAPGGWAEFHECALEFVPENAAAEELYNGSAMQKWLQYILAGALILGKDIRAPLHFRSWMLEAGFTEVTLRQFAVPL